MCNCPSDVKPGSYENVVSFDPPAHMRQYRDNRISEGLSGRISVDACLVDEIKALWFAGIQTSGCCCGHNQRPGYIGVFLSQIEDMKAMGYRVQFNPSRPYAQDSFIPKTVGA